MCVCVCFVVFDFDIVQSPLDHADYMISFILLFIGRMSWIIIKWTFSIFIAAHKFTKAEEGSK